MKAVLLVLLLVIGNAACTTLEAIDVPADELQQQLRAGTLVVPGDRVRLVTADSAEHEFRITEIDLEDDTLIGEEASVPIDDVVALQIRKASPVRTGLLAGGVTIGVAALIAIAIAPAAILSGG